MNENTQALLRSAVEQAMRLPDPEAAMELLRILHPEIVPTRPAAIEPPLPPLVQAEEPPASITAEEEDGGEASSAPQAHSVHFWIVVIKEEFIPHIQSLRRNTFIAAEAYGWVEYQYRDSFIEGDFSTDNFGSFKWKKRFSGALQALRAAGTLQGKPSSRTYTFEAGSQWVKA